MDWKNPDGLILGCVDEEESQILLGEFQLGFCSGHFVAKTTAHKILRAGYYWPTLFTDVHKSVRNLQKCQLFTSPFSQAPKVVVIQAPFQKLGLDFIGKFKDNSSNGYTWEFPSPKLI